MNCINKLYNKKKRSLTIVLMIYLYEYNYETNPEINKFINKNSLNDLSNYK